MKNEEGFLGEKLGAKFATSALKSIESECEKVEALCVFSPIIAERLNAKARIESGVLLLLSAIFSPFKLGNIILFCLRGGEAKKKIFGKFR